MVKSLKVFLCCSWLIQANGLLSSRRIDPAISPSITPHPDVVSISTKSYPSSFIKIQVIIKATLTTIFTGSAVFGRSVWRHHRHVLMVFDSVCPERKSGNHFLRSDERPLLRPPLAESVQTTYKNSRITCFLTSYPLGNVPIA